MPLTVDEVAALVGRAPSVILPPVAFSIGPGPGSVVLLAAIAGLRGYAEIVEFTVDAAATVRVQAGGVDLLPTFSCAAGIPFQLEGLFGPAAADGQDLNIDLVAGVGVTLAGRAVVRRV